MSSSIPASTPGKPWQPPTPGDLAPELPQYEILGLLGRGGMGAVYRARQKSLKREVAIKVLPPSIEDNDMHFAERFKAEAESMARLNHPGIISVYDAGATPGDLLYIIMEFVEGTDVSQMIRASGRLPPEHAHAITAHVCEALAYAHANGLIHRDIKPANIMVDTQGRVKVADFGLAKMANDDSGYTQSNMAVGTPDFVAPEALIPGMPVDGRADLYAVGVMLYQMLTGNIPRGAFKPASVLVHGLDARFDQIVFKAMQVDREERHSSATELRQHLDSLLMPAVPAPDLQRYSSAQMPQTPPPGSRMGVATARPSAGGAATDGRANATPILRQAATPTAPPKSKVPLFIGVAAVLAVGAFILFSGGKQPDVARLAKAESAAPLAPKPQTLASSATAAAPAKVAEAPKPEPKPAVIAKAPEPAKVEPPKPSVSTAKPSVLESQATPVAATPVMTAPTPPVVVAQAPAAPPTAAPSLTVSPSPSPPALPPELAALDATFIKLQAERVTAPFDADLAKLNSSYLGGIGKKIAEEKAAGHLDGILALEAEQKLVTDKQPVPESDDEKAPASLKALRAIYRDAYVKLATTRAANLKLLTEPLDKRLAQMESDFAKGDRLADAKVVRGYREVLSDGRAAGPPAAASVATAATTPNPALGGPSALPLNPAAMLALKDGISNTLGMKFLPVKGTEVLFCIHETRRQDYAAYATDASGVDGAWKTQQRNGIPCGDKDDHPVVGVSWEDAQKFCEWLSKKEGKTYRLPTDEEWSIAVGLGRKEKHGKGITPEMLNGKEQTEFPWGDDYPPKTKDKAGNYGDTAWTEKFPTEPGMKDYTDGFPTTAPVMSFKPNKLGLYDMGGNVWEWVEDWWNAGKTDRVLRGASFADHDRGALLSSYRSHDTSGYRDNSYGFRCVMVVR
ncbi:MAG: protein kinase domain-containing protein [Prosthecobacter sp.]|uniref:bifunctional serine/threonine-protein kinase/formylglycine-generating enzyme family protein n=1 Tax=Prosthecobacter sp. TaxID=1965333 RepID=UPI0038FF242E